MAARISFPEPEYNGRGLYLTACFLAVGFLSFVAGSIATLSDSSPGRYLENAYKAGQALYGQLTNYNDPLQYDLWRGARSDQEGVTIYEPGKAQNGFTLYSSGHQQKATLVDMDGRTVHEWGVPYSAIWDSSSPVKRPQPDGQVYVEKAVLYPNGDLLALYVAVGTTPWGYGLVKMDKDSKVLWKYLGQAHHDVDVAPDGRVYVLTHEIGTTEIKGREYLKPPRIDDYVVVLSPDGLEERKISILDALLRTPYARVLDMVPWYIAKGSGDYLHTNAVEWLDGARAQKLPQAEQGRLMLSFREVGTVAILDVDKGEIAWATRGPWLRQHDPDLLPNGNILLFDNQGHVGPGGITRVMEFDPTTQQIVWSYAGTAEQPFESEVRSSQERLANGNTLITESDGGRLFEVTPAGEIVWNYLNPVRAQRSDGQTVTPIVSWAQRIDPAALQGDFARALGSRVSQRVIPGPVATTTTPPPVRWRG